MRYFSPFSCQYLAYQTFGRASLLIGKFSIRFCSKFYPLSKYFEGVFTFHVAIEKKTPSFIYVCMKCLTAEIAVCASWFLGFPYSRVSKNNNLSKTSGCRLSFFCYSTHHFESNMIRNNRYIDNVTNGFSRI